MNGATYRIVAWSALLLAACVLPCSAEEAPSLQDPGTCECGAVSAQKTEDLAPLSAQTVTVESPAAGESKAVGSEPIEPAFVRNLVPVESGRNDSNPVWSPRGTFLAFERSVGDTKEIRITLADGTPVQTIYCLRAARGDMNFFFPGISQDRSYNAGISWSPDEFRFVYMSNGGEGNYDVYLQNLGDPQPERLTEHKEKDGQARWSPVDNRVVFVSGRSGNGDIYSLDVATHAMNRLTRGAFPYLYPQWSPKGKKIVAMRGANENHDIILIADPSGQSVSETALTTWSADDLRPVWSPDGEKIAFYTNFNTLGDPRNWSIAVIEADGSGPTEGAGLAAKIVARDVLPDVEAGPAWLPDSNRIVYVKNDRQEYNPLYIADVANKTETPLKTDTKMNHDASCSPDGTIAFRAQVDQWDQIFIMRLKE